MAGVSMDLLIEIMEDGANRGTHPSDLRSLNKFLKAAARYAWCIEEQARADEGTPEAERFEDSRAYLTQAFDWALVSAYKDAKG